MNVRGQRTRHDVGAITGRGYGAALQAARDAARGRLVAFGAGLFAAGALIYTARNFSLARQGQVTDRYTKAIEQLGADKGLDVRIGGIYALERIARDSHRDHPTIMEVLAAFIRDHSSEQWPPAEHGAEAPKRATRPDVQAAVTVIGRRNLRHDRQAVDLHSAVLAGADLARADLADAHLEGAHLEGAHLASARLYGATLTGAHLDGATLGLANLGLANLYGAHLAEAFLVGATLAGATLAGADLTSAHLEGADLTSAHLEGAHLTEAFLLGADLGLADLRRADLRRADLRAAEVSGADLEGADLTEVRWPEGVPVPEGWMVDGDSGRLKRAGQLSEVTDHYL